jgi:hypothetical protein
MRARVALLGIVGISGLVVGLMPTAAIAKPPPPVTIYAYEEIGPHSLLADRSTGVTFMEPTCTPDDVNCVTYEFWDRWDVAPTGTEVDQTNVYGYIDVHGYDNFVKHTVKGTMSMVVEGATWTGTFSGTFVGPKAGTGSFSFTGPSNSRYAGTIYFLDDGLMQLTGVVK